MLPSASSDSCIAWVLAEVARPCLSDHQRTLSFVELGSGENHLGIERILTQVAHARFALPTDLVARLHRWLDCYAGSATEHRLRALLAGIPTT